MRINAPDRVRAWGRGHANRVLAFSELSPGEGHNKPIERIAGSQRQGVIGK